MWTVQEEGAASTMALRQERSKLVVFTEQKEVQRCWNGVNRAGQEDVSGEGGVEAKPAGSPAGLGWDLPFSLSAVGRHWRVLGRGLTRMPWNQEESGGLIAGLESKRDRPR